MMTDEQKEAAYYKAAMLKKAPPFVPARVRVLKEREACAKVCDDNHWEDHRLFADAIRTRGQK